ncbi:carboxypeptidase-like regulatory domain-containing protein [Altererythrobacter sp. H2]|uniref:MSCRAMM family protein n=1 Tax=Altererythrobacter sp. H2 TaxID=3108391 RepID=UPI002B4BFE69|nr:carboxypeptidase-like regulatory domain-containing protein [Altererythrobacter sp. H2]WRK96041.1 carboxypeptidase-like regulatory domain-containing protein [Altererythrobacter sp. H2]
MSRFAPRAFGQPALGAIALAAVALGASAPALAQSRWQASDDDALLMKFTVGKHEFLNEVRGYQTDRGVCLDLGDVIQSFDLPVRLDKKSRRATGWLFSEDQTFVIDRDSNTVQNKNTGAAPIQDEILDTPEGWCVRLEALSRWFGVGMTADLYNSAIRIDNAAKLPFIEAIERRSRAARLRKPSQTFDLAAFPRADAEYRLWRTPSVDVNLQARASSVSGTTTRSVRYEMTAAGELGKASYTARLASDDRLQPQSLRVTAYRNQPEGGLLGPLSATRVAAGDVELLPGQLTGRSVVGRGAFIGNRPLGASARFATTTLRGALPAGWDAELYRNGQLIAFQQEDGSGRYLFDEIDLQFGRNEFEIVLYGPQGQVRRVREDVPVGREMVQPGKTFYWGGIVQQDRDLIELRKRFVLPDSGHWRWGVGVERGLDERTSVALGYQSFVLSGKRRQYLEANLQRTFGAMQVQLAGAHELGAGFFVEATALGKVGPVNLAANAAWVTGAFQSDFGSDTLNYRAGLRADTSLKMGKFVLPIQAGVSRIERRDGSKVNEWFLGTSARVLGTSLRAELRRESGSAGNDPGTRLRLLASRRLFGLPLRAGADFVLDGPDKGLERARLSTGKRLDDKSDLNFEAEFETATGTTDFTLGYTRDFRRFALRADASYATNGGIGANVSLAFSLGPDPARGGVRMTSQRLARNGQASVTVFRDDDGDGRLSPGEEPIEGVMVEAGLRFRDAVTGENGKAVVDGLAPFQPVLVGVDLSSLDDPFLVPASKGVVVVPRPGVATEVLLPISPSGEVEGTLLTPNGTPQAGAELELVDRKGAVVASTLSEYDGFFLFDRVPYGQYRLRLTPAVARKLEVRETIPVSITLDRLTDIARLGVIRLEPGPLTIARAGAAPAVSGP